MFTIEIEDRRQVPYKPSVILNLILSVERGIFEYFTVTFNKKI